MAFVHDLLARLRHHGVRPRGPALTLSDHVEELNKREEGARRDQARREQTRRDQARREQTRRGKIKPQPSERESAKPGVAPAETPVVVEREAERRWVPRAF